MYKSGASYVSCRAGIYYYTRRVPYDVRQHYASARLSFSLRTKSNADALRATQSVTQRLEDYWLGLRLQEMCGLVSGIYVSCQSCHLCHILNK